MSTYDWAKHADKIEDLREKSADDPELKTIINKALQWAVANDVMELPELIEALSIAFVSAGTAGHPVNRAMAILLDAYFEEMSND